LKGGGGGGNFPTPEGIRVLRIVRREREGFEHFSRKRVKQKKKLGGMWGERKQVQRRDSG